MTWKDYKNWLDANLLAQDGENVTWQDEVEDKYKQQFPIANSCDFLTTLNRFYCSPEATLNDKNDYHQLPTCQAHQEWRNLIPFANCKLGVKTNNKPIDLEHYNLLAAIYTDWQTEKEEKNTKLAEELGKQAKQWKDDLEAHVKEYMGAEALKFLKSKGINIIAHLKQWLATYQQLSENQQHQLSNAQKEISEALEILENGEKSIKSEAPIPNYSKRWNWRELGKWGLGITVVLFALGLIGHFWKKA